MLEVGMMHWVSAEVSRRLAMRLSLFILGVFATIVWIAYPALAQYAFQSDSVHHRQRVRLSSPPSDFASPPRDPCMASGGGGN
jgi:hypothetical protein